MNPELPFDVRDSTSVAITTAHVTIARARWNCYRRGRRRLRRRSSGLSAPFHNPPDECLMREHWFPRHSCNSGFTS